MGRRVINPDAGPLSLAERSRRQRQRVADERRRLVRGLQAVLDARDLATAQRCAAEALGVEPPRHRYDRLDGQERS